MPIDHFASQKRPPSNATPLFEKWGWVKPKAKSTAPAQPAVQGGGQKSGQAPWPTSKKPLQVIKNPTPQQKSAAAVQAPVTTTPTATTATASQPSFWQRLFGAKTTTTPAAATTATAAQATAPAGNGQTYDGAAAVAQQYLGQHERKDKASLKQLMGGVDPAKTPWCTSFVTSALNQSGSKTPNTLSAGALMNHYKRNGQLISAKDVASGNVYLPDPGSNYNLVAFAKGHGPSGVHPAIVTQLYNDGAMTVGGNVQDSVVNSFFPFDNNDVYGFAYVPRN